MAVVSCSNTAILSFLIRSSFINVYFSEEFSFKEKYTFNFAYYHPYGVSSLVYDEKNALIIAAGNYGKEPFVTENGKFCL